jgi:hypothetical protein
MLTSPQIIRFMEFEYYLSSADCNKYIKVPKFPVGGLYIHVIQKTFFESLILRAQTSRSSSLQNFVRPIGVHDK